MKDLVNEKFNKYIKLMPYIKIQVASLPKLEDCNIHQLEKRLKITEQLSKMIGYLQCYKDMTEMEFNSCE